MLESAPVRYSVGVAGGLAQQILDRRERLEGVMQQNVVATNCLEQTAVGLEALGQPGNEGPVEQVRALDIAEYRHHAGQVDRAADPVEIRLAELELLEQEMGEPVGAVVGDLQAHAVAVAPRQELAA